MLFIRAYYYFFYTFIYSVVILCTILSWLRRPRVNWTLVRRFTEKTPVHSLFHLQSQAG